MCQSLSLASSPWPARFRFGVPDTLPFFGDAQAQAGYAQAVERLCAMGGTPVQIAYTPLAQAAALDQLLADLGQKFDAAVQLTVDNEQIIERLAGRAKAEGRADDSPESVRHRLNVYDQQTAPVIDFYRQHGQLTVVDGVGSLDEVFTRIIEAISAGHDVG